MPTSTSGNWPGAISDDASVGTVAWSDPSYATGGDGGLCATASLLAATSHYLKWLNSTGIYTDIPAGSTIDGIQVSINRKSGAGNVTDSRVRIVKGGSIGATEKASATVWPTSLLAEVYGGSSDLWGETWTRADVVDTGFGVALSATSGASSDTASVDSMVLIVTYTDPSAPAAPKTMAFRLEPSPTDPIFTE